MKKFILLHLLIFLAACQLREDGITVTPPIVEPAAPTAAAVVLDTPLEPTAVPATSEPDTPPSPTAVPAATQTPEPAAMSTPTPTAAPTATPEPILATTIQLVPIASGLFKPVYLTHAFDNRLFVVEQHGVIRIISNGDLLAQPFLDIQDRVGSNASEQGLLSVAFHPRYGENGRFFLNYTNNSGDTVISRFQASSDPNAADPTSEQILLTLPQPFPNHNGGQIQFGSDGYLYIGMGDGGAANDPLGNGQNTDTLLGALLRLDIDHSDGSYAIPADNPFVSGNARNEIWGYGLRNPWRFSFDRLTGDLYLADVGQNTWEEVNFVAAGRPGGINFGWNILEGTHCFSSSNCDPAGLEQPIFEYNHSEGGCSITGGYVYRGQQFPQLWGNYFVGDYCSGNIWATVPTSDGTFTTQRVLGNSGLLISSFGEDAAGELYVLDHQGKVLQIQP